MPTPRTSLYALLLALLACEGDKGDNTDTITDTADSCEQSPWYRDLDQDGSFGA